MAKPTPKPTAKKTAAKKTAAATMPTNRPAVGYDKVRRKQDGKKSWNNGYTN